MRKAPLGAVFILSVLLVLPAYAETVAVAKAKPKTKVTSEESFKSIAQKIAELDQKAIKAGKASADWAEKSQAYRKSLKKFIKTYPKSKWSDDAQYLVGVLSEADKLDVLEKEYFLLTYPDAKAEEWTQKKLDYIVPSKLPLDLSVRMDLCLAYVRRQEKDKLKNLAEESSVKYPDRAIFFKTLVKKYESGTPVT